MEVDDDADDAELFQSLTGRLKTRELVAPRFGFDLEFQSLTGRLKTMYRKPSKRFSESFNPSQVG